MTLDEVIGELRAIDAANHRECIWCLACGEPLDEFGNCHAAGTPGHLDEHGLLLK